MVASIGSKTLELSSSNQIKSSQELDGQRIAMGDALSDLDALGLIGLIATVIGAAGTFASNTGQAIGDGVSSAVNASNAALSKAWPQIQAKLKQAKIGNIQALSSPSNFRNFLRQNDLLKIARGNPTLAAALQQLLNAIPAKNYVLQADSSATLKELETQKDNLLAGGIFTRDDLTFEGKRALDQIERDISNLSKLAPRQIPIKPSNIATPAIQTQTGAVDEKPVTVLKAESENDALRKRIDARKRDRNTNNSSESRRKASNDKRRNGGYRKPK
jgi:hypothetical protein